MEIRLESHASLQRARKETLGFMEDGDVIQINVYDETGARKLFYRVSKKDFGKLIFLFPMLSNNQEVK